MTNDSEDGVEVSSDEEWKGAKDVTSDTGNTGDTSEPSVIDS